MTIAGRDAPAQAAPGTPLRAVPCVALVRPAQPEDPSLSGLDGRRFLPELMAALAAEGVCSRAVAAVPSGLEGEAVLELRRACLEAGVEWFEGSETPQGRLEQIMEVNGWEAALVLTGYAALLDGQALARACEAVASGRARAAWGGGVGPERFFCVVDRQAARALAGRALSGHAGPPLPPTAFPAALQALGVEGLAIDGLESPAERFVTGARLAGEGRPLDAELVRAVLDPARPGAWLDASAQREALRRRCGVADWEALDAAVAPLPADCLDRLAAQVRLFDALREHLPARRGRFVELGAGSVPLCACLLAEHFREGLALEPHVLDEAALAHTRTLARTLRSAWPGLLPGVAGAGPEAPEARALCHEAQRLEALNLPGGSVDFIYSRMTLEHVDDMESLSREFARVLAPEGTMLHRVDFRDHRGEGEHTAVHFDFLRHGPEEWRALDGVTNQLRVSDYVSLWDNLGFAVRVLDRRWRRVPPGTLHPFWANRPEEDLYCYDALLVARRAAGALHGDPSCS
ncbi:hypothetical protein NNJEOMEG_02797 [Fundidesulfovibrio magnetotacticus]|uniref:Methyltransferase type 11 domain-containing protein n=1 Tax=Fundidesulfovibrio magnetotacticus TaxID=2730080 RepID=A0A6V8LY25_9BACT|nr:methyltransferase domain-containing protein [Fundidesulfovibrio magnetotacticus]GFK94949.1 hypothetical protein NNJEOMEG_02797 [Fundidesulfovibrio magnetotacticus]